MSSGPCQKPALAKAWRNAAAREARLAARNHAQRDDAALGFARPGEHQLRSAHRLFYRTRARRRSRRAAAPMYGSSCARQIGWVAVLSPGMSTATSSRDRDAAARAACRRLAVLASSMTGSVLAHGDARLPHHADIVHRGGARRTPSRVVGASSRGAMAAGRSAPRAPPFEARDAGDEQHAGDQQNDAQLGHAVGLMFSRWPCAPLRRRPRTPGASSRARSW